jgi:2-iminobutanoate/2-iminopropanoate deaminase
LPFALVDSHSDAFQIFSQRIVGIRSQGAVSQLAIVTTNIRDMAKTSAPKPLGPYTPVVRAGDWVIVSGQLGIKDGVLVPGGVAGQTTQAVKNLKERLKEAGVSIHDIAKTLCFLTDMDTFATFNEAYVAGFDGARPARSTIGVAALPFGGAVEIEAWAYKPLALAKKAPAKKAPVKKAPAKKTVAKKAVAKKSATRRAKK